MVFMSPSNVVSTPSGSDNADGTKEHPLATIIGAAALAVLASALFLGYNRLEITLAKCDARVAGSGQGAGAPASPAGSLLPHRPGTPNDSGPPTSSSHMFDAGAADSGVAQVCASVMPSSYPTPLSPGQAHALLALLESHVADAAPAPFQPMLLPTVLDGSRYEGRDNTTKEVHRQLLADGRCILWLQTDEQRGAPRTQILGHLAIIGRRGGGLAVEATDSFALDEEAYKWREERLGMRTVYVGAADEVGTGGGESSGGECIWQVERTRVAKIGCYETHFSDQIFDDDIYEGWSAGGDAKVHFGDHGLALSWTYWLQWTPPTADATTFPPEWKEYRGYRKRRSIEIRATTRYTLDADGGLAPAAVAGGTQLPEKAVKTIRGWDLPMTEEAITRLQR